ncbi:MAG TPA: hypothetical protein DEG17_03380 [Cyanobacteria bacterium UBA11149]|nr:hypothetical protein [Cyanobacteria bacterium UBA11367]HBE61063.1 hypothetical protein [Cyanobacteria bacterium UBA11366]HBK62274.1 hypothetical protein [Cyanobacteria bacterium UBA11166]HBR74248.1 hypothetical protein [Cyanobacteria bacterium UBA11159]HBS69855.1 hypothetical protein [Cyanobacteria bacterium UBA11153]HBW87949.1 hypothetical protein [Cyanobacteria bacterium UBA11149]HCA95019.1 hypothetical protein [Cyanobacteria bacterium UBA9226]
MSSISLNPPIRSAARPTPVSTGSEWIQIDLSGLILERWVWNGSLYMSDRKIHSLPIDDMNYVAAGKFWAIGKDQGYGLHLLELNWTPILTSGVYNTSNYWALAISEHQPNNTIGYSTELRTGTLSLTGDTNLSLTKTLNRTVDNGVAKIRLTTYKSGIPPNISHGWIGISYRLTTP